MFPLHYLFLFIGCLVGGTLWAQPPGSPVTPRNGAQVRQIGIKDNTLFDQLLTTMAGVGSSARQTQEQQNLKPYMMPVRKLGVRGTDWSYTLATCLEYYVNLSRNFKDNLSPDYISLSLSSSGQRPSLEQGLQFLVQTGTVSAAIVPYDAAQIPTTVYATAKYQINNYLHLFQSFASPREKIFEIRKALMRGHPVVIDIQADATFPQLTNTLTWEPARAAQPATHTLLVIAYDETRQAFEVMGSWGSQWATNGYLWMGYNDLANVATNGYVMIPNAY